MQQVNQSAKLANVCYDIRGPVMAAAKKMEAEGHRILKLNIGNPAPFGFEAPEEILQDVILNLPAAHGYGDSKGLLSARRAVVQYYQQKQVYGVDIEDVYLGNGVSELIVMALQALLDDGDEVLIPSPDYPLWTAAASLCGGRAVHYRCVEEEGWQPDLDDIESRITDRTRALVIINPNNPTGAVYPRETVAKLADVARRHQLLLLSDEIYDKILYDGVEHTPAAAVAPDILVLTFNGLSKAYRVAGFRTGWLMLTGPKRHAANYIEGLDILANMRLCPNVPTQYAVQTALGGYQSINDLVLPGGRLVEQRDRAWELLTAIPGVSCVKPQGALYMFPRLDPEVYPVKDDLQFVLDLLREEKLLVVQGTGFNWPDPDHFRIVTLPRVADLEDACGRIARFLGRFTG
jgi:alanine-synthesizing transaminase